MDGRRKLATLRVALAVVTGTAALLLMVASSKSAAAQGGRGAGGNAATGQVLFAKIGCETCHGPNGRGTAAGPAIAGSARALPAFIAYVRKPTGTMPAQSAQAVSDAALADIYAFLSTVPSQSAPADAPAGRADNGGAVYRKTGCYQCHGNEAQGGLSGPRIGPDPVPFPRFAQYVRRPTGDMPPYTERVLSNEELADIYAFVQARPRPPAVNSIPELAP